MHRKMPGARSATDAPSVAVVARPDLPGGSGIASISLSRKKQETETAGHGRFHSKGADNTRPARVAQVSRSRNLGLGQSINGNFFVARWFRSLPQLAQIRRILVIKLSALGDIALTTTVFDDIVDAFPDCHIDLNTTPPWHTLFHEDPRFRKVISIALRGTRGRIVGTWQWLRAIRAGRYDLILDLQCNDHTRILLWLLRASGARVPYRLGGRAISPYNVAPQTQAGTTIEHIRATLAAGGIASRGSKPHVYVPESNRRTAQALQQRYGLEPRHFAVFLPGSQAAGYLKRWGVANFAALARRLRAAGIDKVVALGGPDEREECAAIADTGGDWLIDESANTGILDVIPFIEGARFVVANDTGLGHLAAATGVPMVVICGPTDPKRVKPVGEHIRTLQADIYCAGCYRKHCTHHSCMMLVSPEAVFEELQYLDGMTPFRSTPWNEFLIRY